MLTEIPLDQIIGKTVSAYSESFTSGQFVLVFTDGTFTTLKGGEGGLVSGSKIRLMNFEREYIVAVGIATNEELDILAAERAEKIRLSSEAAERRQYERLREQFEGKDTP